jgi:2-dehydro-3-deoxy-D-arabinonate dehydratase
MRLCKVELETGESCVGAWDGGTIRLLPPLAGGTAVTISHLLAHADPKALVEELYPLVNRSIDATAVRLLAPIDRQEVWAAGVTYQRSEEARKRESQGAAVFYDKVYSAARPELFFKSTPNRVVGPGGTVHIRRDSKWSVPEPELALVISPELALVGYTIGNDMSARDIEGENPLYLPQAKFHDGACALGPCVVLAADMPALDDVAIQLVIERAGRTAFEGATKASVIKRTFAELIEWLSRETTFPDGAVLLTGTGIVPPDDFTLEIGDVVHIDVTGIGRLTNVVGVKK